MRLKKVEPDSCANCNCIKSISLAGKDFCKKFRKNMFTMAKQHHSELFDATKFICEDGYEDDGSRFIR